MLVFSTPCTKGHYQGKFLYYSQAYYYVYSQAGLPYLSQLLRHPKYSANRFLGFQFSANRAIFSGALQLELGCHCVFAQCGECSCLAFYLSAGPSSSHGAEEQVVKHQKPHTAKRPHCSSDLYGGSNLKFQHHPNNSATKPRSGILMLHPWRQGQL